MKTIIWWIRRDLRLTDNESLSNAVEHGERVLPIFILDPNLMGSDYVGEKRIRFLHAGLKQLDQDLKKLDSRLILREGTPLKILEELHTEIAFDAIYAEEDHSPYACKRDSEVSARFLSEFFPGPTFRHPMAVRKSNGQPYTVYTPFSKAWKALPFPTKKNLLPKPKQINSPRDLAGIPIASLSPSGFDSTFKAGEKEAMRRLKAFLSGNHAKIAQYASQRDRLDLEGTSQLSPYLRFGMLSAKQAFVESIQRRSKTSNEEVEKGFDTFINELIWREFFHTILFHFPNVRETSFRENLRNIEWDNNQAHFTAWREGQTGYPIVDAAMRQLQRTGWMHNRARMIVASFLVKDLLIDWQWGEKHFMQHLIDGDPAANNGGWQWSAGTGTDAAPYFRIFNPVLQGQKYDPNGEFVKRWLPELCSVPQEYIHKPWEMPFDLQETLSCVIGKHYPEPLVQHHYARERALDRFKRAKESSNLKVEP